MTDLLRRKLNEAILIHKPENEQHFEAGWKMWPTWFDDSTASWQSGFKSRESLEIGRKPAHTTKPGDLHKTLNLDPDELLGQLAMLRHDVTGLLDVFKRLDYLLRNMSQVSMWEINSQLDIGLKFVEKFKEDHRIEPRTIGAITLGKHPNEGEKDDSK